jgi:hypothetical protein
VKTDQGKVAAAAALLDELRSKGPQDFQRTIDDMVTQVIAVAGSSSCTAIAACCVV